MSLPLIALPHIITPSLALSLLSDLLPRLSHSNSNIRKKTVATLYRLALVHPETLRSAWPKIKEILMDEGENSSVTAAVVNVVCELGWRRPRDFLSLAPRLFELLVDGGNNWMAIKIIKLFAILTPLEPRLVKKLLPPLTNLIRTTPAMSLLYECINGVIQGGVLEGADGIGEGDEIAMLCVQKLRGMIVIDGDPNLKYVALLAFTRILSSHSHLVSTQQDVIISCIDDSDISIRLQALDLGVGMVNSDNLVIFVERLIQQLQIAPLPNGVAGHQHRHAPELEPAADSDGEDPEAALRSPQATSESVPALPPEYRIKVIQQILEMCSKDTYSNILDFEWYIEILVRLIKLVPLSSPGQGGLDGSDLQGSHNTDDVSEAIGRELRNVAVRVSTIRVDVVHACEGLLKIFRGQSSLSTPSSVGAGVLYHAAWVVGEYVSGCVDPNVTMDSLLIPKPFTLPVDAICAYLQAIPKVFAFIMSQHVMTFDAERRTSTSLLTSRIINFIEPLSTHPNLEVQERSVEFLELIKIASQSVTHDDQRIDSVPLLLSKAIPDLFRGYELNPVAPSAQRKVPIPEGLDLDTPINADLHLILQQVGKEVYNNASSSEFDAFYNERQAPKALAGPAIDSIPSLEVTQSYQQYSEGSLIPEEAIRRRIERRERNKDDPFYIGSEEFSSGTSTPFHDILHSSNGEMVDVDAIPIMSLDLGDKTAARNQSDIEGKERLRSRPKRVHVTKDETFDTNPDESQIAEKVPITISNAASQTSKERVKKSLLEVDSSNLGSISLTEPEGTTTPRDTSTGIASNNHRQDAEMAKALAEVERLRLEMQRASERIQASDGAPAEGTLVKKKKKKKKALGSAIDEGPTVDDDRGAGVAAAASDDVGTETVVVKKKKKKRRTSTAPPVHAGEEEAFYQG